MGTNRAERTLIKRSRNRQSGMTLIGFLVLAIVVGIVGLAVLKIVPLYLERMKIDAVLVDVEQELAIGGNSVQTIRNALNNRLYIEAVTVEASEMDIKREGEGYTVRIDKQLREPFLADLWFVLMIERQIEIAR